MYIPLTSIFAILTVIVVIGWIGFWSPEARKHKEWYRKNVKEFCTACMKYHLYNHCGVNNG